MADARAKSLGLVTFDHTLHMQENLSPNSVMSEVMMSAGGAHIVYQAEIKTPYITLVSRKHGWLKEDTKNALIELYNQLNTTFTLTYSDDSTDLVRFAHEKGISFDPVSESSEYFFATINLAKVI